MCSSKSWSCLYGRLAELHSASNGLITVWLPRGFLGIQIRVCAQNSQAETVQTLCLS